MCVFKQKVLHHMLYLLLLWINMVSLLSTGSCLSPYSGGDPHPVDHQAFVLKNLQASRDFQTYWEGELSRQRDQTCWSCVCVSLPDCHPIIFCRKKKIWLKSGSPSRWFPLFPRIIRRWNTMLSRGKKKKQQPKTHTLPLLPGLIIIQSLFLNLTFDFPKRWVANQSLSVAFKLLLCIWNQIHSAKAELKSC